jgi:hypothetical protein
MWPRVIQTVRRDGAAPATPEPEHTCGDGGTRAGMDRMSGSCHASCGEKPRRSASYNTIAIAIAAGMPAPLRKVLAAVIL